MREVYEEQGGIMLMKLVLTWLDFTLGLCDHSIAIVHKLTSVNAGSKIRLLLNYTECREHFPWKQIYDLE